MSVRIRLRRVGRKKQPYFRVVVVKRDAPRDGAYIEELGFYNPRTRPAFLTLDLEKLDEWLQNGAEISDSVRSLARKARKGGDDDVVLGQPGVEAPRLKTAKRPERRPASAAADADDSGEAAQKAETGAAAEAKEAEDEKAEVEAEEKVEEKVEEETAAAVEEEVEEQVEEETAAAAEEEVEAEVEEETAAAAEEEVEAEAEEEVEDDDEKEEKEEK